MGLSPGGPLSAIGPARRAWTRRCTRGGRRAQRATASCRPRPADLKRDAGGGHVRVRRLAPLVPIDRKDDIRDQAREFAGLWNTCRAAAVAPKWKEIRACLVLTPGKSISARMERHLPRLCPSFATGIAPVPAV